MHNTKFILSASRRGQMGMSYLTAKLRQRRIWTKIFVERLSEPLHLNALSALVGAFGSFRAKVAHGLVLRPQHAYGILRCADEAKALGLRTVSLVEFGVASGAGLLNMSKVAARVTEETGVEFKIYGFDTGKGMPPARDYRDHPDLFQAGDFPMNVEALRRSLPTNTRLIVGEIAETVEAFIRDLPASEPVGFVSFDVDYYHSTKDALKIFDDPNPEKYLPLTVAYLDDIALERHNPWCGVLLAIEEFNQKSALRKIAAPEFLDTSMIFRRAAWIRQMRFLHILDHPTRRDVSVTAKKRVIANPYLAYSGNKENYKLI